MPQLLHDFLCDESHVLIPVDRDQIAFFLVISNEWRCVLFIDRKSIVGSFFSVIITLIQGAAIIIANSFNLWWVEQRMIGCFACWADTTTGQSGNKLVEWYFDIDSTVELIAEVFHDLIKSICLSDCARETIKDATFLAVVLSETFTDNTNCDFIRNELTTIHISLCFQSERSLICLSFSEHITSGDMWDVKDLFQFVSLGAFTGARRAH